ncbi:hypothetical protein PPERSA_12437 [Pseudocohnilembus persalinus]|uniref:Uncharacterized protein n=1 Tax=Pseudocohnilembus persalinus TaxID=266149 RepID=A0A0V0QNY7_PSEPJ|nr:hypothetical protein PPERSA_12437 [Pseudocohnilembus persalinus]|eukprot:KRX03990.1 hypothetical protein PPERSA_12437 [Pseudocohnilembus persalinus]
MESFRYQLNEDIGQAISQKAQKLFQHFSQKDSECFKKNSDSVDKYLKCMTNLIEGSENAEKEIQYQVGGIIYEMQNCQKKSEDDKNKLRQCADNVKQQAEAQLDKITNKFINQYK